MAGVSPHAAVSSLIELLSLEATTVRGRVAGGQMPSPPQLAAFLKTLVDRMGPMIGACPPAAGAMAKGGFESIGWDVIKNGPQPATKPPHHEQMLQMMDQLVQRLRREGPGPPPTQPGLALHPAGPSIHCADCQALINPPGQPLQGRVDDTTGGWYCNSCWAKWDGGGGGGGATTAASAQPHNPQAQYQQALARVQEEEATKAAAEARILGLCFLGWTMNVPASYMHGGGRLIAGGGW
jgi:hypothetical protein